MASFSEAPQTKMQLDDVAEPLKTESSSMNGQLHDLMAGFSLENAARAYSSDLRTVLRAHGAGSDEADRLADPSLQFIPFNRRTVSKIHHLCKRCGNLHPEPLPSSRCTDKSKNRFESRLNNTGWEGTFKFLLHRGFRPYFVTPQERQFDFSGLLMHPEQLAQSGNIREKVTRHAKKLKERNELSKPRPKALKNRKKREQKQALHGLERLTLNSSETPKFISKRDNNNPDLPDLGTSGAKLHAIYGLVEQLVSNNVKTSDVTMLDQDDEV